MLDDKIIQKCIQGDRNAQRELYNFYASRMRGICIRYARSDFEAEDIFQDSFIKVFTNLKNFNNQGSFDGWIRRIVTNTAIDHYKKNLNLSKHIQYEDSDNEEIAEGEEIIGDLNAKDLLKVLSELPPGYKLIFNLYAIEGYTHKEIAEQLNIAESTSKSQLTKARRFIKALLFKKNILENENGI